MNKGIIFSFFKKLFPRFLKRSIKSKFGWKLSFLYGYKANTAQVFKPICIGNVKHVFLYEYTRIQYGAKIINNFGKFILKKYSAFGAGLTIATTNHVPTIGIPHFFLGLYHINDDEKDIIVEEDVWGGTNVTLLNGAHISRGCVLGAGTMVNKYIPPYAVVVGSPAKIIKYKYNIIQILEHEKKIYPESERLTKSQLEEIFDTYYKGLKQMKVESIIKKTDKINPIPALY